MIDRLSPRWQTLCVFALAFVLCLPFLRYVAWLGDEGVFLRGAEQLLRGERLYRDVFAFLPPGAYLLIAGWLGLFGVSLVAARLLALLVLAAIAAQSFSLCLRLGVSRAASAVLVLCFLTCSLGDWTVISHHWFTTLLVLSSVLLSLRGAPVTAGLCAGAAVLCTPTRGALAGLAGLVVFCLAGRPTRRASVARFLLGGLIAPALCGLYLLQQGTLQDALSSTLLYTGRHYSTIQGVVYGEGIGIQNAPLVLGLPVALLLGAVPVLRRRLTDPAQLTAFLLAVVAFVGCFPRPDATHVLFNAPLALPLFGRSTLPLLYRLPRPAAVIFGLALAVPAIVAYSVSVVRCLLTRTVSTPRGPAVLGDATTPLELAPLLARIATTDRSDGFFFYPYDPMLPFLTARRHVARFDIFTPGYTVSAHYEATRQTVRAQARYVVFDKLWMSPAHLLRLWPAMTDPDPPYKRALEVNLRGASTLLFETERYELRQLY